jgi:hypothetical protein
MKTNMLPIALAAALLTSTTPVAMANVAVCGRTLFTPPGSNVLTGTWHRLEGQQLCAGLVVHGDGTATYAFGDGNLTHPKGGKVSDNGKTYSFVDGEGSTFTFHSDGSASFSGGSGKMVGQFNVYHMPGVAADPKPEEGFLGSTNPSVEDNQGFSDSTEAPATRSWYILHYADAKCIASDVEARNAHIPALVSPGKSWTQATKEGLSPKIESLPKDSNDPTAVIMTVQDKDTQAKTTMMWFRNHGDCDSYVETLPPNQKGLN